jgi:hypothetical protein
MGGWPTSLPLRELLEMAALKLAEGSLTDVFRKERALTSHLNGEEEVASFALAPVIGSCS